MARSPHLEAVPPAGTRLIRIPQPVLAHEEFGLGPPAFRRGGRLSHLERRYILWRLSQRASRSQIAAELGISRKTVWNVIRWARSDSRNLLVIGLVVRLPAGYRQRKSRWACVLDGQVFIDPARASRWAWSLLFDPEHNFMTEDP